MREPVRRTLVRAAALAVMIICLSASLAGQRQAAHAAATASISVLNGRVGLLHLSGSGFAPNQTLYLTIAGATIANPSYVTRYITVLTTPTGSFDFDYPLGEFVCGTYLRLVVSDRQDVLAESPTILGTCPATTPTLTITGVSAGRIGISGQGFAIAETVGISVTSLLTGAITGTVTMSDSTGAISATVPLGPIGCGESIQALARGSAGSSAASPPFFYNCLPPQPGEPVHAPPPDPPARSAGQSAAVLHGHPVHGVRLDVSSGPPSLTVNEFETLRIATGVPGVRIAVWLTIPGKTLASLSVRADARGEAVVAYRVPLHPSPGSQVVVTYTVSYHTGRLQFLHSDTFVVRGS
jgi:hypothetical protein